MKKFSSIWLALAACLSSLLFTGCPGLFQKHTVTFYDEANWTDEEDVLNGMPCPKPTDPEATENYFLYWSESYASNKEAKPFDFNTPITSDKTLYAIYAPKLYNEKIIWDLDLTSTPTIKIALYGWYYLYPLTDGSYAGITLSHSTDGTTWENVELTVPSDSETKYAGSYSRTILTYDFSTSLIEGTNYFKVTNGHEEAEVTKDYIKPENVRTVTFIDGTTTTKTVELASGSKLSSSDKPVNPYKDYNYFMYWSKSRASQTTAVEFDFDTEITEDTTLYAIYTPKLYTSSTFITSLTPNLIKLCLYRYRISTYPLDD
ncbi:MAG: InlB B-repeat-containing protein, partial [Treponema sp.]|nr:InlB B-repeat-containing protein [Treponema sp.]